MPPRGSERPVLRRLSVMEFRGVLRGGMVVSQSDGSGECGPLTVPIQAIQQGKGKIGGPVASDAMANVHASLHVGQSPTGRRVRAAGGCVDRSRRGRWSLDDIQNPLDPSVPDPGWDSGCSRSNILRIAEPLHG